MLIFWREKDAFEEIVRGLCRDGSRYRRVEEVVVKVQKVTRRAVNATRHHPFLPPPSSLLLLVNIMSDPKKQERDFTPEVDALIPEATALVEVCAYYVKFFAVY